MICILAFPGGTILIRRVVRQSVPRRRDRGPVAFVCVLLSLCGAQFDDSDQVVRRGAEFEVLLKL